MITLWNGQVCFTEGKISLDLRLADGMSSKTHLQVIDAETTYEILLRNGFYGGELCQFRI